jgi:Ca-activated chloride channel family protein
MTLAIQPLPPGEPNVIEEDTGFGALSTPRGNLPLTEIAVRAGITGLAAGVEVTQGFHNPYDEPLEATYVFPLPSRAAVTGMRMEAAGRVVVAQLKERAQARADYEQALAEGRRASIAEEERPEVFTLRVGNIVPGEQVTVRLSLVQPLPYEDGEATFRFPLVVAPRYVPGNPLPGAPVGAGVEPDTDAVPDASRISPPVLLPGVPNPVRLSIDVDVDPAGLPLEGVRSSLHAVVQEGDRISIRPGERVDRDFVLRLRHGRDQDGATALSVGDGTFRLTVLPPDPGPGRTPRGRDVVLLLDRSGSMRGWKMVAARRAAARIVDTLTTADRFAVLGFDHEVEWPLDLLAGLSEGSDRNRYRAVEHLARLDARGGTEILPALVQALGLLTERAPDAARDRVLVLVTDGQVANEDQLLRELAGPLGGGVRLHAIGIDQAVNAGFLTRLAAAAGGRCELVESEDRLEEAAEAIHRRIGAPLLTGVRLDGAPVDGASMSPARPADLFPGVPLVITGRWSGPDGVTHVRVNGRTSGGEDWSAEVPVTTVSQAEGATMTAIWARAHLRDLEDTYATGAVHLEQGIVATSLRHGLLCRFTAFVAVDTEVVTGGTPTHRVLQPVEPAAGWDMLAGTGFAHPAPGTALRFAGGMTPARAGRPARDSGRMAMRRILGAERAPSPAPQLPEEIRSRLQEELRRLREEAGGTGARRSAWLADLGTRLSALVAELTATGLHTPQVQRLHLLAEELSASAHAAGGAELDELWRHCEAVLASLAEPAVAVHTPTREAFWKGGSPREPPDPAR